MSTQDLQGSGFFRLQQVGKQWTFVEPDGGAFFSIGVNHVEESNLKYPHNIEIWKRKYGSRETWKQKGPLTDLPAWGFNTLGWTQEYVSGESGNFTWSGSPVNFGHSFGWAPEELISCGMPYIANLPVADFEDWRAGATFPDVFSSDFDAWCAFLARSICSTHADSKNLLGYFYVDVPAWVPHANGRFFPGMEGLRGDKYDNRLNEIATQYYRTLYANIRKIDKNHLIFGDRFNGNKNIPDSVLDAVGPYVDAVSLKYFASPPVDDIPNMVSLFQRIHDRVQKPTMNVDIANWTGTKMNPNRSSGPSTLSSNEERGQAYSAALQALAEKPWFVGWHWCGYVENLARGWGIKDPWDEPYHDFVNHIISANAGTVDAHKRKFGGNTFDE